MGRIGKEAFTDGHSKQAQSIVLDDTMEVILKSGTQKEVDDLQEQLSEAHTEISNLKAYIQLKESEILYLKEKVSNEILKS